MTPAGQTYPYFEMDGPQLIRHVLTAGDLSVGRTANNDIQIDDPEVSRSHARITWQGQAVWLLDLNSSNGTFVNGRRVQQPVELKDGDRVQFAGVQTTFHAAGAQPEGTGPGAAFGELPGPPQDVDLNIPTLRSTPSPWQQGAVHSRPLDQEFSTDQSGVHTPPPGPAPRFPSIQPGSPPQSGSSFPPVQPGPRQSPHDGGPMQPPGSQPQSGRFPPPAGGSSDQQPAAGEASSGPPAAALEKVGGGPIVLTKLDTTIGRVPGNDIVIADDTFVSHWHARILNQDGHFLLIDLGSSNGTYVNGVKVTQAWELEPGDEILFGTSAFFFRRLAPVQKKRRKGGPAVPGGPPQGHPGGPPRGPRT